MRIPVARCTVERLKHLRGLRGVVRAKVVRTTSSNTRAPCPLDRANRQFNADRSNRHSLETFRGIVHRGNIVETSEAGEELLGLLSRITEHLARQ